MYLYQIVMHVMVSSRICILSTSDPRISLTLWSLFSTLLKVIHLSILLSTPRVTYD